MEKENLSKIVIVSLFILIAINIYEMVFYKTPTRAEYTFILFSFSVILFILIMIS